MSTPKRLQNSLNALFRLGRPPCLTQKNWPYSTMIIFYVLPTSPRKLLIQRACPMQQADKMPKIGVRFKIDEKNREQRRGVRGIMKLCRPEMDPDNEMWRKPVERRLQ
jgi:hypothetical protein